MIIRRGLVLGAAMLFSAVMLSAVCYGGSVGTKKNYDRATSFIQKGEYDRALGELQRAIQYDANNAQYRFTRADLYLKLGQPAMAIEDYTSIIENNPNNGQAYHARAILYFSAKEYENCWKDVHKAQDLGYAFDTTFIDGLKKASGKDK